MSFGDLKVSCVSVDVLSLLMLLASELHTVNSAILLPGFLSILNFTVRHISLGSKPYIYSKESFSEDFELVVMYLMFSSKLGSVSREKLNNLVIRNNSLCLPFFVLTVREH